MKLLTLLSLSTPLILCSPHQQYQSFSLCLTKCQNAVAPCLKDTTTDCSQVFGKCLNSEDPQTCLASVNGIKISKILQCFEGKCGNWAEGAKVYGQFFDVASFQEDGHESKAV